MSDLGFVAMDRGIFDHPAFANEAFTEREAWLWMITQAAWKPHQKRVGKAVVNLDRGQLSHSVRFMATRWRWSKSRVDRFLSRLEMEGMITIGCKNAGHTSGQQPGQITICNFDVYQSARDTNEPDSGTVAGQNRTKEQLSSEAKASSGARKRGSRLPGDWQPDELFAAREGLSAWEIAREADKFRDYWRAQPGQKGVKVDWDGTWRNWVRNAAGKRKSTEGEPIQRRKGFGFG